MRRSDTAELADYLLSHPPVDIASTFAEGTAFGEWRIAAFLGRGGSGEVYRAIHSGTGQVAALKVLLPKPESSSNGDASRARFRQEIAFLSQNKTPFFPRFYASGEANGCPFVAMEMLDARPLPSRDRAVASFLLKVCAAARHLHRRGFVHRDIKPQNILWRADGTPVLIDLGLLKGTADAPGHTGATITIANGRAVGAGTPHYAAPEQFEGGAISAAADVHALGVLIDACFCGHLPRDWENIVRRATSSMPEYRYRSVDGLMRAIRWRHLTRWYAWARAAAGLAIVLAAFWGSREFVRDGGPSSGVPSKPYGMGGSSQERPGEGAAEGIRSPTLWRNVETNVVRSELVLAKTNRVNGLDVIATRVFRNVTNRIQGAVMRLDGETHTMSNRVVLTPDREWWIVGPGTLEADLTGSDTGNCTRVHLDKCVLLNRTSLFPMEAAVQYVFHPGAYLNFVNQGKEDELYHRPSLRGHVENFDGAFNAIEFGGPRTIGGLMERRRAEIREMLNKDAL